MSKKRTVSMRAIGYLLLMGGLLLLTGQACVYLLSLNNVVSPPPPSPAQPALTSASVENGMVYFTANEGISALRASDGKQIWHIQRFLIDPPIVAGGVIYARDFGDIFALRGSDGTQLWQYPFFQQPNAQAQPVQVIGDRVYVYDGQALSVLIAGRGIPAWSTSDPVDVIDINTLTISDGVVYYAARDGNNTTSTIYARQALDGKILWRYSASVAGQPCAVASIARALDVIYASASCNSGAGRTFALRASDGALLWQFNVSGQFSVTDGVVCLRVTQTQGSPALADLYVLQASTGKLLWSDAPGTSQDATQMLMPGNGYVYMLRNNVLNARRLSDGQPAWSMEIPYNAASQTFETFSDPVFLGALNNIVYIQSSVVNQVTHIVFNRLYALQASTGKQLWSFQQQPSNLTWTTFNIDARTGVISIQGLDAHNPTDLYLLRATDGKPLGSVIQSQEVNNVLIANGTVYITSIAGDGNNTPFTYQVRALHPNDEGGKMLWGFGT